MAYLTTLKDSIGNNYLGIRVDKSMVDIYLNELKNRIGDEFDKYTQLQQIRDNSHYHITVINVMDYNKLIKEFGMDKFINSIENLLHYNIDDLKLLGLGTASKNENRAYFVVCESITLDSIRSKFNLPKHDFHITLGFYHKDVFGVPKNQIMEEYSPFLNILREEFFKRENFNFVRQISNFDDSTELEIIPISITNTFLQVQCGDYILGIGISDPDNKLFIFTKYKKSSEVRLPLTEIYKILK